MNLSDPVHLLKNHIEPAVSKYFRTKILWRVVADVYACIATVD